MRAEVKQQMRQLFARRETIRFLTSSGLQDLNRDKILGNLWSLLDPLLFMAVYYVVFGVVFNMAGSGRSGQFMIYIFLGVVTFRFAEVSLGQSVTSIRGHRGIIHETNVPKAVFPVASVLARFYDFLWGLLVLVAILVATGYRPTLFILLLPVILMAYFVFVLGVSLIAADIGVFFVDASNLVTVVMRVLFYLSPVFYFVRDRGGFKAMGPFHNQTVKALYFLNPLTGFIECLRDLLMWGAAPSRWLILYLIGVSIASLVVGLILFSRREGRYAKYI